MTTVDTTTLRARLLKPGLRFAFPVPDGLMAVLFACAAIVDFLSPEQLARLPHFFVQSRGELVFALMAEGGFLLMQGTLVDIATRLRKRPPIWVIPLILGALVLFSDEARMILAVAWERGTIVFLPLAISLAERGTILWRMPDRSRIEKIAERALIANRITTGLGLFGIVTLMMVAGTVFIDHFDLFNGAWVPLAAGAIYFAVAAYDDWRVRGAKFAEKPSVLFRFDPMHIHYLEPV